MYIPQYRIAGAPGPIHCMFIGIMIIILTAITHYCTNYHIFYSIRLSKYLFPKLLDKQEKGWGQGFIGLRSGYNYPLSTV